MDSISSLALIVAAYLVGSVPTAYIVGRLAGGVDIRAHGSGNIGASNLTAQVGAKWAGPVVVFDVLAKGSLPVFLASDVMFDLGLSTQITAGIAGVVGHNWSLFSGLRGGRGIATILGATFVLSVPLVFVYGLIPALGMLFTPWKDSALWWLVGVLLLPVWAVLLNLPGEVVWYSVGITLVTVVKRMTSNSLRDDQGQISVKLLFTRLVYDRDIASREDWIRS